MELTENRDILQTVFDSAANGIAVMQSAYNEQGRVEDFSILLFNTYTLKWIGDTDYKGKRYGDVFPMVKETGILEKFIEVAETGVPANFESWYAGEGMNHWFRFTAVKQADLLVVTTEDITDLKQAEKSLQQSETRFRTMIEQAPIATCLFVGREMKIDIANDIMVRYWGKGASVMGKSLAEALPELKGQPFLQQLDEVFTTGKTFETEAAPAELIIDGVPGTYYFNYTFKPLFNEQGEVYGIMDMAVDVTEQVVARKNLEESDARFRNLLQEAPVAATLFRGPDLIIEIANELTQKYWGKSKEIIGKPVAEAAPELEDQQMIALLNDIYQRGGAVSFSETPITFNENGLLKHGYYTHSLKALYDTNGNVESILAIGIEVTEQVKTRKRIEESEQDLRNLVLQSPTGICVIDAATLISEIVNDKFIEIAGKPYEAIMGKHYWDTFAEAAPYYAAALQEVVDKGEAFYVNEVAMMLIRHGKEENIYVTFVYEPMKDVSGSVKKVVVWVMENTLQVQARQKVEESESSYKVLSETLEQQVNERTKELQRSNEDLQQFAHVASHDLKEPVRKIKTFASRLEEQLDGKLDEAATRFMERIHVATDRMFTMIDGVLAYSTINAGTQKPEAVDLNEVVKNIETDLELALQKTGGTIQYHHLPTLEGAPVLLYQLFYNLINNSLKFAKVGVPPQITIVSEAAVEYQESFARITLQDNGIGFDPEQAERIFETFSRLNAKDKYEGTGLGLSLCKKIVERHGGNIIAKGELGKGATFTIMLPLQQKETGI